MKLLKPLLGLMLGLMLLDAHQAAATEWLRKPRRKPAVQTAQHTAPAAPEIEEPSAPEQPERPAAEVRPEVNDMALRLTAAQFDSLVAAWVEQGRSTLYESYFSNCIAPDTLPVDSLTANRAADSLYAQRLRLIVSPIPMPYNAVVGELIQRFTDPQKFHFDRILGLANYYFPLFEEVLLQEGLPVELRMLPVIESALTPEATSRAGAAGLWQFMPTTGKIFGLEINSMVDERRDPVPATQAACRYLKQMYATYGDWLLALAAYNCGPGNVNKAIARSGGKRSFWELYDYLPAETRRYVPSFIAATYTFAYHELHGIEPLAAPIPLAVDTLRIGRLTHFEQIASTIDIPVELLRMLNPQYKLDIIPATAKPYTLVLPQRNIAQFIDRQSEIHAKDTLYLKEYLDPANLARKQAEPPAGSYYKVKSGDTLGAIARRYGVTTAQLMRWNNISDARKLRVGQRIRVSAR